MQCLYLTLFPVSLGTAFVVSSQDILHLLIAKTKQPKKNLGSDFFKVSSFPCFPVLYLEKNCTF